MRNVLKDLETRFEFLNSKKTKKYIQKRVSKRKKQKRVNKEKNYDIKLANLIDSKNVFGNGKTNQTSRENEDSFNVNHFEFNQNLDSLNRALFELKQLKDFSQTLTKLLNVRSKQKDQNPSFLQLDEIFDLIDQKRNEYESNKKSILGK